MSESTELADLYSAIEESARRLDVPCSRDKVWPILTSFENVLPLSTDAIMYRMATGARRAGEVDCRITLLPGDIDPHAVAASNGLIESTDHPVSALLSDIEERCPVATYGIDFGVVGGFAKVWSFFPGDDKQDVAKLADIPSMPRSLAENLGFFSRYGLDESSLIGVDYPDRTVNVYFTGLPAGCGQPENVRAMLRDLGLPAPSEKFLELAPRAFAAYFTLSWDSLKVERVCFAVITEDAMALPVELEPQVGQFVNDVPLGAGHKFVYGAVSTPGGEYYKLSTHTSGLSNRVERQAASANAA